MAKICIILIFANVLSSCVCVAYRNIQLEHTRIYGVLCASWDICITNDTNMEIMTTKNEKQAEKKCWEQKRQPKIVAKMKQTTKKTYTKMKRTTKAQMFVCVCVI